MSSPPSLHAAFRAALSENVASLIDTLEVIAVELLTAGCSETAQFFFSTASAVRAFARSEDLLSDSEPATAVTSSVSSMFG